MTTTLLWPHQVLRPMQVAANVTPFSRSGGVSLGGIERSIRTDRGWWRIQYKGVLLSTALQRRAWEALATELSGKAGVIAVPVWSFGLAPWLAGTVHGRFVVPHSDGAPFSDDAGYAQPGIVVEMAATAAIGATSVTLRQVYGLESLSGIRFSYDHALYRTGRATAIEGSLWTVLVSPAIRAAIPQDARLELDLPTCLVHLATDDTMDSTFSGSRADRVDVAFVEATDHWADLAEE